LKIIGVTGGIGSGKSTVSKILSSLGAKIIDADAIAHKVTEDSNVLTELSEKFGASIITAERKLDRERLASIVFEDTKELKELNNITHKYVAKKIIKEIEDIKAIGKNKIIVLDVPIPVKHGFLDVVDEVWVVVAEEQTRIKRVMKRSNVSYEEVQKRIKSQMSNDEYIKISDRVIENNEGLLELRRHIESLI